MYARARLIEPDAEKAAQMLYQAALHPPVLTGKVGYGLLNPETLTVQLPTVQFLSAQFTADETEQRAIITVTRIGDVSGTASVRYQTLDKTGNVGCSDTTNNQGAAYARCDYVTSTDTLTFGPGVVQQSFTVPLIPDSRTEGPEAFTIQLYDSRGAMLGPQVQAVVTIGESGAASSSNPIFQTPFFVRQHYLDFLSREPEATEPWSAVLNGCPNVNNLDPASSSAGCDRIAVSSSLFGSPEFQLKGFYVFLYYKVTLNRLATYDEIVGDMRSVTGTTSQEVYDRKAQFARAWLVRRDMNDAFLGFTNGNLVDLWAGDSSVYHLTKITTRDPASPDTGPIVEITLANLVTRMNSGQVNRSQALRAIVESQEVRNTEFNSAFVAMQYYGYLRRTPEAGGYNAWLNYLNAHPSEFRTMVNGFMNSVEYRLRFGQP